MESVLAPLRDKTLDQVAADDLLRDIKLALLEADVSLRVTKGFLSLLSDKLAEADRSIPARDFVAGTCLAELRRLLGEAYTLPATRPLVVAVCGLQGAGKTTFCAKLANRSEFASPLLVAGDLFRPAAVQQLVTMAGSVPTLCAEPGESSVSLAARVRDHAAAHGHDVVVVDTAGRQSVDADLMDELNGIFAACQPDVVLLALDAATGQGSLDIATSFASLCAVDAVVLTKMDGDSRGGLALSVAGTLGLPVAFVSTGERVRDLTLFHPERIARRILGEGDLLTLAEQVEAEMGPPDKPSSTFTLDDFLYYTGKIRSMGPVNQLLAMVPGVPSALRETTIDDNHVARIEAMIRSMTPKERAHPELIDASRAERIACGSGVAPEAVGNLLEQFANIGTYFSKLSRRTG